MKERRCISRLRAGEPLKSNWAHKRSLVRWSAGWSIRRPPSQRLLQYGGVDPPTKNIIAGKASLKKIKEIYVFPAQQRLREFVSNSPAG